MEKKCDPIPTVPTVATIQRPRGRQGATKPATITPRQRCVLDMLSSGYSNKQIAAMLDIAESTVKAHVSSLLRAVACTNRTQLAVTVLELDKSPRGDEGPDRQRLAAQGEPARDKLGLAGR